MGRAPEPVPSARLGDLWRSRGRRVQPGRLVRDAPPATTAVTASIAEQDRQSAAPPYAMAAGSPSCFSGLPEVGRMTASRPPEEETVPHRRPAVVVPTHDPGRRR